MIETLIRTLEPAERALGAKVKAHHGPLILRRAAFKCLVARLALWPQFEMAFDRRNSGALHELEPLWQNRDFVHPFNSFSGLHCLYRVAHFFICLPRRFGAERLFRILVAQIVLDCLDADDVGIRSGDSAESFFVSEIIPENPETTEAEIALVRRDVPAVRLFGDELEELIRSFLSA